MIKQKWVYESFPQAQLEAVLIDLVTVGAVCDINKMAGGAE